MKKLFMLAAMVLGLASCQSEPEGLDVVIGGEQEVMLNVSLPESTRGASSTGFDFTNFAANSDYDLRFILEIAHNGEKIRKVETTNTTSMTFPVRLAPTREYTFTVWADLVEEGENTDLFYNTADLSKITFNSWTPNVEARDAYTMTMTKTFVAGTDLSMELTRPFAKVRVVATDIENVRDFEIEPTKAIVKYNTELYTSFNAVKGEVITNEATKKSHEFNYADVDNYADVNGQFTVLADYIFVPASGTVQFSVDVKQGDNTIKKSEFNTAIPVEKNKITSIVGDILTDGGNVSITVDSVLGEKETIKFVNSAATLQKAINDIAEGESGNIKLGGDVDLDEMLNAGILATRAEKQYGVEIPAGKSVVLDLNGKKIFQTKECTANYAMIVNKGNLTIVDESETPGKISFTDSGEGDPTYGWGTYTIRNEGTLVVENGVIEHLGQQEAHMICAIFQYSGSSTIYGGTISTPAYRSARLWNGDMTINDGNFEGQLWLQAVKNDAANLTINGGTFAPRGNDSSSVFVTNSSYNVTFAVTGGYFTTKIGMSKPFGCITGGTFTDAAMENTNKELLDGEYCFVDNGNGTWAVAEKPAVAKIGDVEYKTLIAAAAAVQDGETITLLSDETFTEKNRTHNSGTWYDGLYYVGDKSFTLDLNGKTISHDGSVNDYLLNFKNVGSKVNTITIKNGTVDAGTAAFCALCTSSVQENQLTINLEDVTLYNNISNGSTTKIRGGVILNANAGTKIIGENSYLGIECIGATVNIYEGAEIYMNGKSSYNGCLAGVGYGGTINVYGGYGKGVKGGFIAMTSGGTINVAGGEWIANTDGTVGSDSNYYVLTAQSNKYESGFAGGSYINVTGGTFRGGMDAWVLNNIEGEIAKINIKGGNFNVNPTRFLADGYTATQDNESGIWTVEKMGYYTDADGNYHITNAKGLAWVSENVNTMEFYVNQAANIFDGKTVYLDNDIDLGGAEWRPIGDYAFSRTSFNGVFDGQGYTVSNFKVTNPVQWDQKVSEASYGFFGNVKGTIKNLNIKNATVNPEGGRYSAALVGRLHNGGNIENCHVEDSSVTILHWQVGGLVGQNNNGNISGCSVVNSTITGKAAVGAIVGMDMAAGEHAIKNCRIAGTDLVQNESFGASYDASYGLAVGLVNVSGIVLNVENVVAENNTIKGVADNTLVGDIEVGAKVTINGVSIVTNAEQLVAAIMAGGECKLNADIAMTETVAISNANFTLDGNGYTITMAEETTNTYALFDITRGKATIKNVTFDGIKEGAVVRTVDVEFNAENVIAKNGQHTQQQGLFRLIGKSTIKNCEFTNNTCNLVITLNYDGANSDPQVIENCLFEGNTCNATAVLYYVKGAGATINGNKFISNTVNCNGNGATVYMGFQENCVVKNNLFQDNTVNEAGTSSRVAGGIFFGYETEFTGNAFVGNSVTGSNAKATDACVSTYYTNIDLSGNYWGGNAPVKDVNYFVQHTDRGFVVIINDYLTENPIK